MKQLVITYACVVVLSDPVEIVAHGAFRSVLVKVVRAVLAVSRTCYKQNNSITCTAYTQKETSYTELCAVLFIMFKVFYISPPTDLFDLIPPRLLREVVSHIAITGCM